MKRLRLRRLLCFAAALALAIPALSLRAAAAGIMNGTGISFTPPRKLHPRAEHPDDRETGKGRVKS